MSEYSTLLWISGSGAVFCFVLTYYANNSLDRLSRREYDERQAEGMTVERAEYFARVGERRTRFANATFWIGVGFAAVFVTMVGIRLMAWP